MRESTGMLSFSSLDLPSNFPSKYRYRIGLPSTRCVTVFLYAGANSRLK